MKKVYIASAVLAMAALVSCQENEIRNNVYVPEEGEILFRLDGGSKSTKASDSEQAVRGAVIDLGTENGTNFVLEETVTRLDDVVYAPETKGTPGYTENFQYLYKGFDATVYKKSGSSYGTTAYETDGRFELFNKEDRIYKRKYPNDIWDESKEGNGLYFFLKAYEGNSMAGVSGTPVYHLTHVDAVTAGESQHLEYNVGSISFSYDGSSLPKTEGAVEAKDTKDILFTSREITSDADYAKFISETQGVPVLFHHVLTGVKFAIANYDADKQITINEVIFNGLMDKGDCVVTPKSASKWTSGETDTDNITDFSSAETSLWSNRKSSGTAFSSGSFGAPVTFETGAGNFENSEENKYPSSFSAAGATYNLNDKNATQTFWLVPQEMTDAITLTIKYTFGSDEEKTWTIDFGEVLAKKNVVWHAGELHTYTIKIDEVNVKIEDTVTTQNPETQYKGSTKQNVIITNTGNTDTYIRAAIIGQWLNSEGNPVFGFTDFTASADEQFVLVDSWYKDQFTASGKHEHGAFKNLVGYNNDGEDGKPGSTAYTSDWWIKGPDGFYYFKYVVPAGKAVPAQDSATKYIAVTANGTSEKTVGAPLFESYTIKDAPDATVAGHVEDIYFELEIATQAISAKDSDGSYLTLSEAWARAGITITE